LSFSTLYIPFDKNLKNFAFLLTRTLRNILKDYCRDDVNETR